MQRISDLIWMANGVTKIGQATLRLTCDESLHFARTSSIIRPIMDQCDKMCQKRKVGPVPFNEDIDFEIPPEEEQFEFKPEASDIPVSDKTVSSQQDSSGIPHTHQRHYSTHVSGFRQNWLSSCSHRVCQKSFLLPKRCFSTSSHLGAITGEELAMLAKVRQTRRSKTAGDPPVNGSHNINKMQEKLNTEAQERKVPTSRVARLASFGGLAASVAAGTVIDGAKKTLGMAVEDPVGSGSSVLTDANLAKVVSTLCKVRGAALKLGQMLSMQDDAVIDPRLLEAFERVRQSADFMPPSQMKKVLKEEFGAEWRSLVRDFDEKPFAAASIGQVHRAVLFDGREVAMKIQYPGVSDSINSDIDNLVTLLKFWDVFPEQMYMEKFIAVARKELAWECDYEREARYSKLFRDTLADEELYGVPEVMPELSSKRVLTTELVIGIPINQATELEQDERNFIAAALLRLTLKEIFEMRCMQTDPNWSNFFYNQDQQKIYLLDFGASRTYDKKFVDDYIEVVKAAALNDRETVVRKSKDLGFLTGYEPKVMEDAHVEAIMILGECFKNDEVFDFGSQNTSRRIVQLVPTFLKHRLTPPPEQSYSLHRKLSGVFQIACKLQAQFACKKMFDGIYDQYWQLPAE